MSELELYDADAQSHGARFIADMLDVAAWIREQCDARGLGFPSRVNAHRMHGRLIQRGIVHTDALKQALAQYIGNGCAQSARNEEIF